jgi:uncharacterized RDD family membrane protein YckC
MEGTACRSDDPSTPPNAMAHPAWQLLTEPGAAKLAWRRAACQNPDVCAVSETSRGGLLQILQEAGLAVPPKTKGAVNAYVTASLTDELGQAMQSYLGSTTEPFYRSSPKEHTNYGGKGAGQQLWWSATKGWRVTQPNRHMMAHLAGASASASAVHGRGGGDEGAAAGRPRVRVKRQRIPSPTVSLSETDPVGISEEDIGMLPMHSAAAAAAGEEDIGMLPMHSDAEAAAAAAAAAEEEEEEEEEDDEVDQEGEHDHGNADNDEDEDADLLLELFENSSSSSGDGPWPPTDLDWGDASGPPLHGDGLHSPEVGGGLLATQEWVVESDQHFEPAQDHADTMAPSPAPIPPAVVIDGGSSASPGGGQAKGTSEQQAGAKPALTGAELLLHVKRLAESLPQAQKQALHEQLSESLPGPYVIEAQHVEIDSTGATPQGLLSQPGGSNPVSPSDVNMQQQPRTGTHHGGSISAQAAQAAGAGGDSAATRPAGQHVTPKSAGRDAEAPPLLYPGSLEPVIAASWVRRLMSHMLDVVVLHLLIPSRLRRTWLMITGSLAMDFVAHARWPGQSLGKRVLGIQILGSHQGTFSPSSSLRWSQHTKVKSFATAMLRSFFMNVLFHLGFVKVSPFSFLVTFRWNYWSRAMLLSLAVGLFPEAWLLGNGRRTGGGGARRCLHDQIFGTLVVQHRSEVQH